VTAYDRAGLSADSNPSNGVCIHSTALDNDYVKDGDAITIFDGLDQYQAFSEMDVQYQHSTRVAARWSFSCAITSTDCDCGTADIGAAYFTWAVIDEVSSEVLYEEEVVLALTASADSLPLIQSRRYKVRVTATSKAGMTTISHSDGFVYDATPPAVGGGLQLYLRPAPSPDLSISPGARVGPTVYQGSYSTLAATWVSACGEDAQIPVSRVSVAWGTTPGLADVAAFQPANTESECTAGGLASPCTLHTGLNLQVHQRYYAVYRCINDHGLASNITAELGTLAVQVGSSDTTTGEMQEYDSRAAEARGHGVEYSSSNGYFQQVYQREGSYGVRERQCITFSSSCTRTDSSCWFKLELRRKWNGESSSSVPVELGTFPEDTSAPARCYHSGCTGWVAPVVVQSARLNSLSHRPSVSSSLQSEVDAVVNPWSIHESVVISSHAVIDPISVLALGGSSSDWCVDFPATHGNLLEMVVLAEDGTDGTHIATVETMTDGALPFEPIGGTDEAWRPSQMTGSFDLDYQSRTDSVSVKWHFTDSETPLRHVCGLVSTATSVVGGMMFEQIYPVPIVQGTPCPGPATSDSSESNMVLQGASNFELTEAPGTRQYVFIKVCNQAGGCTYHRSDGFETDGDRPVINYVHDQTVGMRSAVEVDYTSQGASLHASWSAMDSDSGILRYEWAIGHEPYRLDCPTCGGEEIMSFTPYYSRALENGGYERVIIGNTDQQNATIHELELEDGLFYVTVRAIDRAGNVGIRSSDGIYVSSALGHRGGKVWVKNQASELGSLVYQSSRSHLRAEWGQFRERSDTAQGAISSFEWAIGTSADGVDVQDFTPVRGTDAARDNLWLDRGGRYFVSVRATNYAGIVRLISSTAVEIDDTPPQFGAVFDGEIGVVRELEDPLAPDYNNRAYRSLSVNNDVDFTRSRTFHGRWANFTDPESYVLSYHWAVSTYPRGSNIRPFVDVGLNQAGSFTASNAADGPAPGVKYFVSVKAFNGAGLFSSFTSDGIIHDFDAPMVTIDAFGESSVYITLDASACSNTSLSHNEGHADTRAFRYTHAATWLCVEWPQAFVEWESGIHHYEWAVEYTPLHAIEANSTAFVQLPSHQTSVLADLTLLSIPSGSEMAVVVRAVNRAGGVSSARSSSVNLAFNPPTIPNCTAANCIDDGWSGYTTSVPTSAPTTTPTSAPTDVPTDTPTGTPTDAPTDTPTDTPTAPTDMPTAAPTGVPTGAPTDMPTDTPTDAPSAAPTDSPTDVPTDVPTSAPTDVPTGTPTDVPTSMPTLPGCDNGARTGSETGIDCGGPECPGCDDGEDCLGHSDCLSNNCMDSTCTTAAPTDVPTSAPTDVPTGTPTDVPTGTPTTDSPTDSPTGAPSDAPTDAPTGAPTGTPTDVPTSAPTDVPTDSPTDAGDTNAPTPAPTSDYPYECVVRSAKYQASRIGVELTFDRFDTPRDGESGIEFYEWAVGTTPRSHDLQNFTN
jgi:hypothetical protein